MVLFVEGILHDFRYALRGLLRRRGITALSIASVAAGIAVSTATFSVVDAVLIKPLPYEDSDRLVMVWNVNPKEGFDLEQQRLGGRSMSPPEFIDWQEDSGVFEGMVAFTSWFGTITEGDTPERFFGYQASPGVFQLLGVQPYLGRGFLPEEENGTSEPALVLQYDFWQRRFQGDRSIVGQLLRMRGGEWRIVGVMPPGFVFFSRQIEALATMQVDAEWRTGRRNRRWLRVMARLKPGVSLQETQASANVFARNLAQEHPTANAGWSPQLFSVAEDASGGIRPGMYALLVAVGCVLIILCANVANLLLVQATVRAKELALRSALGAGRWRIVRQLLTESTALAVTGGLAGIALAWLMVRYFQTLIPDRYAWGKYLVQAEAVQMDWRVAVFGLLASLAVGLVCGILPGLHATRSSFNEELKEVSRGSVGARRGQRIRSALVVAEFALTIVMVIGAALLAKSFFALQQQGSGFHSSNLLTVNLWMPTDTLREQTRDLSQEEANKIWQAASASFRDRILSELKALPSVEAVTQSTRQPISAFYNLGEYEVEGRPQQPESESLKAIPTSVDPNYFEVTGLPLLRGRAFGSEDQPESRAVAIVSDLMARTSWPGEDPVGKRFRWKWNNSDAPWITVVGVCGDIREDGLHRPPQPYVYMSLVQQPSGFGYYFLKTANDPYSLVGPVEKAARQVDRETVVYRPRTLDDLVRDSTWQLNYSMLLLSGLAWLALFLALIGVYGVISYSVRERTREIGVRMALGAQRAQVLNLILWQGLRLAGIGTLIGVALAAGLTRFLETLLFGVEPLDLITFASVALTMVAVASLASYIPARRAAKVDPMVALRHE